MKCGGCVSAIKDGLSALEGVNDLQFDLPNKTVDISFDEAKISFEEIKQTLQTIGYAAKIPGKGFFKSLFGK